ncbi:MAG: DUF664 domain-containing protein [Streptosporangiaceae bacterium]
MSWTALDVTRIDEPFTGPERGILDGFLDWHRSTLLWKCAGLTGEQFALASVPPSNLSLLGIVQHMADVERAWFRIRFRGEPLPRLYDYEDAAFEHVDPARAEADFAAFTEECDLARKAKTAHKRSSSQSRLHALDLRKPCPEMPRDAWESLHGSSRKWFPEQRPRSPKSGTEQRLLAPLPIITGTSAPTSLKHQVRTAARPSMPKPGPGLPPAPSAEQRPSRRVDAPLG